MLISFIFYSLTDQPAKTSIYNWWSNNLGKNNLEIDKNISLTSSETNLSKTSNCTDNENVTSSKSTSFTGLKLSNSFTSFTLSSLMKASEETMNLAMNSISSCNEMKEESKTETKAEII